MSRAVTTAHRHLYYPLVPSNSALGDLLWIGTWSQGGEGYGRADGSEVITLLLRALDHGFTHYDSAGFYAHGRSEELLSKAFHGQRQRVFLATKGGLSWQGRRVIHDGSKQALLKTLHESLTRLKTDYIDLYQLHWPDPLTPIAESLAALADFKQAGLIRFYGACNLTPEQITTHLQPNERLPHQVHFNPLHRNDTHLHSGALQNRCFNAIISPLEQGLLSGRPASYHPSVLGRKDIRRRNPHFHEPTALALAERFAANCKAGSMAAATVMLLWILTRPYVDAVVTGPRTLAQLEEIIAVSNFLTAQGLLPFTGTPAEREAIRGVLQRLSYSDPFI